jgi:hypothetical protein
VDQPRTRWHFVEREACPACGEPDAATLWRSSIHDGALGPYLRDFYRRDLPDCIYQLDECRSCGLYFQRFVADAATMDFIYSELAIGPTGPEQVPSYAADMADPFGSRDAHELMSFAAHLKKPKLKTLDYGTGYGFWSSIARKLGHDSHGVELSPEKADWAARHGATIISDDEIAGHRFDVISLEQVLEHVPNPFDLLATLVPSLDGVLKISVPNAAQTPSIIAQMKRGNCSNLMPIHPLEHINGFTRHSLGRLGERLGLKEVRPSFPQRYAFLRGGIPSSPKRLLKEAVRPFWTYNNRTNLYMWFSR